MKSLYFLIVLVLLTSCSRTEVQVSQAPETPIPPVIVEEVPVDDTLVNDIVSEIEDLGVTAENEVVTLDGSYKNPKGNVDMKIDYVTDTKGIITSLNVSATSYDLGKFNESTQVLIGKTLKDAEEFYMSGSSLTTEAFTKAIKNR